MKYKVIKTFPGSPKLGHIVTGGNGFSYRDRGFGGKLTLHETWKSFPEKEVESSPEFFAPYLFTTEDRVDVYAYDDFYYIGDAKNICQTKCLFKGDGDFSKFKTFSTREAAQKWIDEQNKPKFEVGQWVYFNDTYSYGIFRFKSIVDSVHSTDEGYQIGINNNWVDAHIQSKRYVKDNNCSKATPEQIQDVLSRVAIHKGFKEGVRFKSAMTEYSYKVSEYVAFRYQDHCDALNEGWGNCVYYQGKWAEIVKEEVPEYVECVSEYPPIGATKGKIYKAFYQPNSLNPYRWYTDGAASGENGYSTLEMFNQIFKSSTKAEYDAQFQTKEITITLDGDVVNTSHWGNNVKITYK